MILVQAAANLNYIGTKKYKSHILRADEVTTICGYATDKPGQDWQIVETHAFEGFDLLLIDCRRCRKTIMINEVKQ